MLFVAFAIRARQQEMVFETPTTARSPCSRAPAARLYDNMKTAWRDRISSAKGVYTSPFMQMCSHYLVDSGACTQASDGRRARSRTRLGCPGALLHARMAVQNPRRVELNSGAVDKCIADAKGAPASRNKKNFFFGPTAVWEVFEGRPTEGSFLCGRFEGFPPLVRHRLDDRRAVRQQ